ncbi:hypothetical protein KMS_R14110 [Pseudomonas sp. LRP2-20]|nr:hypothetical protein KMS_R14110 [Pseudomonas sp. LRP2-20]
MQALDRQYIAEHHQIAPSQQAAEQGLIEQCDEAELMLCQSLQESQCRLATHQCRGEITEKIQRPTVEQGQDVAAVEQRIRAGVPSVGQAHWQYIVARVGKHALRHHQRYFVMRLKHLDLTFDAQRKQPVVIAQHLDQIGAGQLHGTNDILAEAKPARIALIAQGDVVRHFNRCHQRLDLACLAVIADQHLQPPLRLHDRALQRHGEMLRVVGRNDDTDDRGFSHNARP